MGSEILERVAIAPEKKDLALLGKRTLEGLSLTVDSRRKKLVASGRLLAAKAETE